MLEMLGLLGAELEPTVSGRGTILPYDILAGPWNSSKIHLKHSKYDR